MMNLNLVYVAHNEEQAVKQLQKFISKMRKQKRYFSLIKLQSAFNGTYIFEVTELQQPKN